MKYPIILMDADDTLLDFDRSETCAISDVLRQCGVSPTDEALADYKACNKRWWQAFERKECDKPALLAGRFREFFGGRGIECDPDRVNALYLEALGSYSFTLPEAETLCRALRDRGRRLYIVTNGNAVVQARRLAASPLRPLIDGTFVSDELGVQKPEPGFFDRVFEALGRPPKEDCIILGDSPTSDMLGGRRYGIATCWYNPKGLPGGQWDYEIGRLTDFLSILSD